MIPVRDVVPSRTRPGLTLALMAAGFVATAVAATGAWTADADARTSVVFAHLAAAFGHGSWPALLTNSLLLWLLGPAVEDRTGHLRFAVLYVVCGLFGVATLSLMGLDAPWRAAAGSATAGVAAAHLASFPTSKVLALSPGRAWWTVVEWPTTVVVAAWLLVPAADALGALDSSPLAQGAALVAALAGGASGVVAMGWLRRPERLAVEWWDASPDERRG